MNRRGFLKGAAGLLSLPLVGKMASSVKSPMVREGIANVANVVSDAPVYFWKLVDKIKMLGDDVTEKAATADRQVVKKYKDYELTEDVSTGEIKIMKNSQSDEALERFGGENANEEIYMRYKPSEKILLDESNPGGGVRKTLPEYEENTLYISNNRGNTGEILEEVSGVPDDIFLEVGEQVPEFLRKGKADGGIINLAGQDRVGRWMGGSMSAGKSTLRDMLRYFSKGSKHGKSGAEMLKMVNPKQILKYLENPNDLFMKGSSKEGIMATDMVKDYATKVEGERSMMIGELLNAAKNIRKGDKSINEYKEKIIKEMMDKGANREMAENLAEMVSGMAQKAGGRTPTPNITDQGLLELENIQKNLLTKGRSLNADGGRIELAKGGIPRALQAALKTIRSKFGDDSIKNLEKSSELNDYRFEASPEFNIKRPESAIIRDKMKNFGKPGQYNPDGSIDYDYYAQILNDEENIFVSGLESIEELEAMKKERFDYYDDMREMYDRGELDKYAPSKLDNVNDNQIAEAVENIFPTGDIKLDAEMAAESLVELNPQIFGDILYEDLDSVTRSKIYGAVLEVISGNTAKMIQQSKNLSKPTNTLASIKAGKGINISDPNILDEFTNFMKESDPKGYNDLEQKVELSNFNPKGKKGNADGGIIGLTSNPRSASNKAGVETLFKRR